MPEKTDLSETTDKTIETIPEDDTQKPAGRCAESKMPAEGIKPAAEPTRSCD